MSTNDNERRTCLNVDLIADIIFGSMYFIPSDLLKMATRDDWRAVARAVITTMRVPTAEMLDAPPPIAGENPSAEEVWQAMIDKILE